LHACVEHPQDEVEDAMIAEFTPRPPPGHRQVRKDKCDELWLGELNGNRRRRWTFGHIAHRKWLDDKHEQLTSESPISSYNTMGYRMDETRNHLNYRILARQRSRFTHYYFYIRDETLGPMVMRVASFLPFQTTYYLNGHSFIE